MSSFDVKLAVVELTGEAETLALGAQLEQHLNPGDVIGLEGEMGAGKSVLARGMIRAAATRAGITLEDIPSPTFTLVQYYPRPANNKKSGSEHLIWHVDLWRLDTPQEAFDIGLDEGMANAVCVIEWMSKLGAATPKNGLQITLKQGRDPSIRQVSFHVAAAYQSYWRAILETAGITTEPLL